MSPGWLAAVGTLWLSGAAPGSTAAAPATQARPDTTLPYERVVDSIRYPPPRSAGWVWCTGTPEAARYCFDPHDSTVVRWYELRVDADTTITLTVSSADFDVRMALRADGSGRTINDDGAGACNARIPNRQLSHDTLYVLVVGQHLRVPGRFTVDPTASDSASDAIWDPGGCVTDRVTPQPHSFVPVPSAGWHTLTVGPESVSVALDSLMAPLSGSVARGSEDSLVVVAWLTPLDGRLGQARHAQLWPLAVTQDIGTLVLSVASRRFSPNLYLIGPRSYRGVGGPSPADSACKLATVVAAGLPSGRYRVVVSDSGAGEFGSFSLAIGRDTLHAPCPTPPGLARLTPGVDTTLAASASAYLQLTRAVLLRGAPGSLATVVVRGPANRGRTLYLSYDGAVRPAFVDSALCVGRMSFRFPSDGMVRLDVSDAAGASQEPLTLRVYSGVPDAVPSECGKLVEAVIALGASTDSVLGTPVDPGLPDVPYVIEVRSRQFDPLAQIVRADGSVLPDDNGGPWCNARVAVRDPMPGDRLKVFDASGRTTHAVYAVSFDSLGAPAEEPDLCRSPRLPARLVKLDAIPFGPPLERMPALVDLPAAHALEDGTHAVRWHLADDLGRAGRWLVLESAAFDPYLWIVGDDFILGDDDSGPGCSAALPAPASSLDVVANSKVPGVHGTALLRLQDAKPRDSPCLTGAYFTFDQLPAVDTLVLHAADSIVRNGALTNSDARLVEDTTWAQAVVLRVDSSAAHVTLVFRLDSPEFDPWLIVMGPDGSTRENDDGGDGHNSRIEWPAAPPGEYRIVVNSWGREDEGRGAYTLVVTGHSPARRRE